MRKIGNGHWVKAFCEIDHNSFQRELSSEIREEINNQKKEYILGVDEDTYKKYLIDKYTLEPLNIDKNSEIIDEPKTSHEYSNNPAFRQQQLIEVYNFTVRYNFSGSPILFNIQPSQRNVVTNNIYINVQDKTVSFEFKVYKQDQAEFNIEKNRNYDNAFANLTYANEDARGWNKQIPDTINHYFKTQKDKYIQENNFFAAINVKINNDTKSVFTAPTIKKKVVLQPIVSKNKEFSSEPTMAMDLYNDILKVIYDTGKSMERKPSVYEDKDEEGLRDQFLFLLETRYDGVAATGETFNRNGKTDILLKYANDGSNVFIAECKFWHGPVEFKQAINQLFDRYLTWRDSKIALIIFVTNKDFTNVIQTIKTEVKTHEYFVREAGNRGESSFSYIFRLPQDKGKQVYFEIMMFHFDKL